MSRGKSWILCGLLLMLAVGACSADVYSGGLSLSGGGLLGTGAWAKTGAGTTLDWTVTIRPGGNEWVNYTYQLNVPVGEVSHFILEVSPDFTKNDIFNYSGDFEKIEIGWFYPGGGEPNMPDKIWGVKFDEAFSTTFNVSFDSWRLPVWGDFYSKDGKAGGQGMNTIWNRGFTKPDWDPSDPPQDGTLCNHLLVPNGVIPEPGTFALMGLGLPLLAWARRRRRS